MIHKHQTTLTAVARASATFRKAIADSAPRSDAGDAEDAAWDFAEILNDLAEAAPAIFGKHPDAEEAVYRLTLAAKEFSSTFEALAADNSPEEHDCDDESPCPICA
jgi:hypothetical protein